MLNKELKEVREAAGDTLDIVALKTGVSSGQLSRMERGLIQLKDPKKIEALREYFTEAKQRARQKYANIFNE